MCTTDECGAPGRRDILKQGIALGAVGLIEAAAPPPAPRGEDVTFATPVGPVAGYLAMPKQAGRHHAVLIMHGNLGTGEGGAHRITADELADAGFVALVHSRFSRIPGFDYAALRKDNQGEQHFLSETFFQEEEQELHGALAYLAAHKRVRGRKFGAVGFCGGGIHAVRLTLSEPSIGAAISFYGPPALPPQYKHKTDPIIDLVDIGTRVKVPLQMHYGTADYAVKGADIDRLAAEVRSAGTEVETYAYEGATHAFYDSTVRDAPAANAQAAAVARGRYLGFLRKHLG